MQSTIGNVNLDKVFESLSQAQQKFLENATQRHNFPGDLMGSDPIADARQFLMNLLSFNAGRIAQIQSEYLQKQLELWTSMWFRNSAKRVAEPDKSDRRFEAPEWKEYPLFDYIKRAYLLTSDGLMQAVESANLDEKTKQEMAFF